MAKDMKFSIITVCLNSEETIEQTIQSVIRQNYNNYEYIVVDGGSTDETLRIIEKYKRDISIIISEPDKGIYNAMNKGIALSTGDLIGIINSDDWYEPDILKLVAKRLLESDAEVIYGRMNILEENGEINEFILNDIESLRYEMSVPHPATFIKKDIYKKYGMFDENYEIAADYELMLRLYVNGVKFNHINKIVANFRRGGISGRKRNKAIEETVGIAQNYLLYAPYSKRKHLRDIIDYRYKASCFENIMNEFPDVLISVLNQKIGVGLNDNIAIFGAGKWGIKLYEIMKENGIYSLTLVDNNEKKWDQNVFSPEILREYKGVLIVAVKEFGKDILLQVEKLCNLDMYILSWNDIVISCLMSMNEIFGCSIKI